MAKRSAPTQKKMIFVKRYGQIRAFFDLQYSSKICMQGEWGFHPEWNAIFYASEKWEQIFDPPEPLGMVRENQKKLFQARNCLTRGFCRVSNADSKTVVGCETRYFYGGVTLICRSVDLMVPSESVDQKYISNRSRSTMETVISLRILCSFRW